MSSYVDVDRLTTRAKAPGPAVVEAAARAGFASVNGHAQAVVSHGGTGTVSARRNAPGHQS